MHHAKVNSATIVGVMALPVEVEVDLGRGLPNFIIVGLPDKAVAEAKERVRAAIRTVAKDGLPQRRVTINLAPAQYRKEGSLFDMAITLGILAADGYIDEAKLKDKLFIGEVSLDGLIRGVNGVLPALKMAREQGLKAAFIPAENAAEAAVVDGLEIFIVSNLEEVVKYLRDEAELKPQIQTDVKITEIEPEVNFTDIKGQPLAKRAAIIAAAGRHHLFLYGPPGTGKTMLAKAIAGIMPDLSKEEAIEVATVRSVSVGGVDKYLYRRPFRAPHHTASQIALVGGGQHPQPGEITLAHRGVLFLDELPEFPRSAIEVLREPLESGKVLISRAEERVEFPSEFLLVAAQNPCPCGYLGDPVKECKCSQNEIRRYNRKISGPFLDRIDIFVVMNRIQGNELLGAANKTSSKDAKKEVTRAREKQMERQGKLNGLLSAKDIKHLAIMREALIGLGQIITKMSLSARGGHRLIKLSRTIADLNDHDIIEASDLMEAMQYRELPGY